MTPIRFRAALFAATVLAAATALAGCNAAANQANRDAGAAGVASQPSGGPVNVATPESVGPPSKGFPTPVPTSTVLPPDAKTPSPAPDGPPGDVVLSGSVRAGAEPSCLVLTSDKIEYLLLTPAGSTIRDGDAVQVVGHVEHGIMTHCMQGMPFQVDRVMSAKPGS